MSDSGKQSRGLAVLLVYLWKIESISLKQIAGETGTTSYRLTNFLETQTSITDEMFTALKEYAKAKIESGNYWHLYKDTLSDAYRNVYGRENAEDVIDDAGFINSLGVICSNASQLYDVIGGKWLCIRSSSDKRVRWHVSFLNIKPLFITNSDIIHFSLYSLTDQITNNERKYKGRVFSKNNNPNNSYIYFIGNRATDENDVMLMTWQRINTYDSSKKVEIVSGIIQTCDSYDRPIITRITCINLPESNNILKHEEDIYHTLRKNVNSIIGHKSKTELSRFYYHYSEIVDKNDRSKRENKSTMLFSQDTLKIITEMQENKIIYI